MKGLSVLVLRSNSRAAGMEGAAEHPHHGDRAAARTVFITVALFAMAIINLFTKKTATVWDSRYRMHLCHLHAERALQRRKTGHAHELEKFRLISQEMISQESLKVRRAIFWWRSESYELGHSKGFCRESTREGWISCTDRQANFGP